MRRRLHPQGLQRQLLLWAGVVALALSLLAMHQLSLNHTAADPTFRLAAEPAGNVAAGSSLHAGPKSGHAHTAGHSQLDAAAVDSTPPSPAGCPGCAEHQAMSLTCLVALTLLAAGLLLAGPVRWPGLLRRHRSRGLPQDRRRRWRGRPLTLVELSVSRT